MTARLIALMSAVLLLSLAAFAFLMVHFQAGVMSALGTTVSMVGQQTIRLLESPEPDRPRRPDPEAVALASRARNVSVRQSGDRLFISEDGGPEREVGLPAPAGGGSAYRYRILTENVHSGPAPGDPDRHVFVVQVDDVRTETEPGKGMVLRIPTRDGRPGPPDPATAATWTTAAGHPARTAAGGAHLVDREIRLPIPTASFQVLFEAMRRRLLLWFVAVLAVGIALSAWLASHFTRPVRRLDAALHRLSAGDLDVTVDARGNDEVGRLGRAFNEMAQQLRRGREQARELSRREKLSALGRLAAGVAHDLRNPLHSIGLTLDHVRDACRPEDPARAAELDRSVALVRDEIRRLDKLVGNFLLFARTDRRLRGPVDLSEVLRDVSRLITPAAERARVAVELRVEGSPPVIEGEAEALRSSVLNLVLNSLEAMGPGGTLTLALAGGPEGVRLEVADTGRGIPEAEQDRVFDFAYSTREGGNGLGLAMVHQVVVEDHGGRVELESRPGQGTRVRLSFPAPPPSPSPADGSGAMAEVPA